MERGTRKGKQNSKTAKQNRGREMKTVATEKNNKKPKPQIQTETDTEKEKETEKEKMEGLENLYTFRAGSSCGLYSIGEEFWESLVEKINPNPEKQTQTNKK
jgi:hypothetical protein